VYLDFINLMLIVYELTLYVCVCVVMIVWLVTQEQMTFQVMLVRH